MTRVAAPARLDAVHASGLLELDEAGRRPLERLIGLACEQLGLPMAAVSVLTEDRPVLCAGRGLEHLDPGMDADLCRRVVESDGPEAVGDVRRDPGRHGDAAPAPAGVLAYAGVPLHDAAGQVLGTLCVADPEPRDWSPADIGLLEELSEIATAELVLRATAAEAQRASRQAGAVVAAALDAIITIDADGLVLEFNPAAERMFGRPRDQALGRRLSELIIPPALRGAHEAGVARNAAGGLSRVLDRRLELTAQRADGSEFPVELIATRTDDGDKPTYTGFVRDLSAQRAAEKALREVETRLALTVETAPVALFGLDADGIVTVLEGSALDSFGMPPSQLIGQSVHRLYRNRPDVRADLERILAGEAQEVVHRFGASVFEIRGRPLLDDAGRVTGAAGIAIDITQRLSDEARIAELVYSDPLTRLRNRAALEVEVGRVLGHDARRAGRTAAVLCLDLDDFQAVNDSLGYDAGDTVLRDTAARLAARVGSHGSLARQSADEFLVFLDDLGPEPALAAEAAASDLLAALEPPVRSAGLEFSLEASVGIALFPRDGDDFAELLRAAESALHHAKHTPGCRLAVHQRDDAAARRRLTLSARLRRALSQGEFVLHYQPIFALADGRPTGVEALLRWEDPELGRLPPDEFIPMAETTGLIVPLGEWVAEEACRQSVAWRQAGIDVAVGFNVSPVQLARGDFACRLAAILERTQADPARMTVEVTESSAMDTAAGTHGVLERLLALGFTVVVDDFGAGHSSLTRLRQLDVGALKIDRALLEGVPEDEGAVAVVTATLALAEALGIPTVGEGVETEAQRTFLRDRGCRWAQGFGLARPMDAAAVTELLRARLAPATPA